MQKFSSAMVRISMNHFRSGDGIRFVKTRNTGAVQKFGICIVNPIFVLVRAKVTLQVLVTECHRSRPALEG